MKLALVHATLLLVALGFAYETWTREVDPPTAPGSVTIWDAESDDVDAIDYETDLLTVTIERRNDEYGDYLWAVVTRRPEPDTADATPMDEEARLMAEREAAERSASGDTAVEPSPPSPPAEPEVARFVVGDQEGQILRDSARPLALRELGNLDQERIEQYGLDDPYARFRVRIGRDERELLLGEQPWGTSDRYALEPRSGRAFVLHGTIVRAMERAIDELPQRRLHTFDRNRLASVVLRAGSGERTMAQNPAPAAGGPRMWSNPDEPDQPDQTFTNFMDRLGQLWVAEYAADVDPASLTHVFRVEYRDERGRSLGFLDLYRRPGSDPTEYYVVSEVTRVAGRVYEGIAAQLEQDLAQLL